MTGQDLCQTQDQVDHSSQDSRVVLDGKGKPAVTVSIEGMLISIESSNINILVQCSGHAVKPIPRRKTVQGEREVWFYRQVFSSSEPEHLQWRALVPHFYGLQTVTAEDGQLDQSIVLGNK